MPMTLLGSVARTGVEASRRAAEVALAPPRIAFALERLADSADDLRRLADASEEVRQVLRTVNDDDVAVARQTIQGLLDAVSQLNGVVSSLNTTVSPLQGATERLGRLVDRLPQGRRRIIDATPGPGA
jgi:methyl-accepting chemotaxis protein